MVKIKKLFFMGLVGICLLGQGKAVSSTEETPMQELLDLENTFAGSVNVCLSATKAYKKACQESKVPTLEDTQSIIKASQAMIEAAAKLDKKIKETLKDTKPDPSERQQMKKRQRDAAKACASALIVAQYATQYAAKDILKKTTFLERTILPLLAAPIIGAYVGGILGGCLLGAVGLCAGAVVGFAIGIPAGPFWAAKSTIGHLCGKVAKAIRKRRCKRALKIAEEYGNRGRFIEANMEKIYDKTESVRSIRRFSLGSSDSRSSLSSHREEDPAVIVAAQ